MTRIPRTIALLTALIVSLASFTLTGSIPAQAHEDEGAAAYSTSRAGDIKVTLLTVQLADKSAAETAAISLSAATGAINTASNYWKSMSNGRLSISVASTRTGFKSSATSGQSYYTIMDTVTREFGWVGGAYTALVVFIPTSTLSGGAMGAGWSANGTSGRVLMPMPGSLTNSVLTHEFGHVLGLMHANSLQCGSGVQDVATTPEGNFADPSCSIREYGDSLDVMGISQTSQPVISSPMWEYGGFGRGDEVLDIGKASGINSYTLKAWAGTEPHRAVKFRDPLSGETYYLELRLPVGYDSATAVNNSSVTNKGVKIVQPTGAGSVELMPSSLPFPGYYAKNQVWQAGQKFTTHAGTKVTIDWISDTAAGVTIDTLPAGKPLLVSPGDFNGDGIADLIMRRPNGDLWFSPGDGWGKYLAGQKIGSGWQIYDHVIGTGDFNGDGINDLVARKHDGSLWFYAGTGTVSATSEGYRGAIKIGEYGWDAFASLLGVRDFNGDGKPDLLARRPDGILLLYPGLGTGHPGMPVQIDYGWQIFDQLIAIQDFNGDGTNDLAGRKPDGTLWLYQNNGKATLLYPEQIGTGWSVYDTILGTGDANGDRTADFVARQPDGSVFFYAGTAMRDEGYQGARKIGDFGWEAFDSLVPVKDFNGDGISDLLARTRNGALWFYPGNGAGAYGSPRRIGDYGWEAFDSLTGTGDFSGDGKSDLLARKPDGTLWLYLGTGRIDSTSSGYTAPVKIGEYGWDVFMSLAGPGDMNGDGRSDILARRKDGTLWLYPGTAKVDASNNGYAAPVKVGDYGWEGFDSLFGVGDYNADGKNDLVARKPDGTLWMYPGTGTGKLSLPRRIGTGWNVYDAVLGAGKLNADSYPDLVARRPDGSLWAYSGTGMQKSEGYLPRIFSGNLGT